MTDQAQGLRNMMNTRKNKQTKIITVTSGKGGVGKSSLALNLAISLSRQGKCVLIVDMDFGFSNIDVMLGVNTKYDLMDVVNHNKDIQGIIEVGCEGVHFISGGSGVYELTKLDQNQLMAIVNNLYALENIADTIIFDTGAGVSENILRLIRASHETILVTTPEPTAIVDAYALLKIAGEEGNALSLSLVLNKAENPKEAQTVMDGLVQVVEKNLGMDIKKLGYIMRDINMEKAIKMQSPILVSYPKCVASVNINMLARYYLDLPAASSVKLGLAGFLEKFLSRKSLLMG